MLLTAQQKMPPKGNASHVYQQIHSGQTRLESSYATRANEKFKNLKNYSI